MFSIPRTKLSSELCCSAGSTFFSMVLIRDPAERNRGPVFRSWREKPAAVGALILLGLASCRQQEALPEKPCYSGGGRRWSSRPTIAQTVRSTGEIRARVEGNLSFRVSGRITERNVDVGAHVTADEALARIDPAEQEANVRSAEATVAAAEAQLQQVSATFERQKTLLAQGYTTRRDYDQAEEAFPHHPKDRSIPREHSLPPRMTNSLGRSYTPAFRVWLRPSTSRSATLCRPHSQCSQSPTTVRATPYFNVQESFLVQESDDSAVDITLLSNPEIKTSGRVREVSPTVDPANGTVRIKVGIQDLPAAMMLRSAVTGEGKTKPRKTIVLPWGALSSYNGPSCRMDRGRARPHRVAETDLHRALRHRNHCRPGRAKSRRGGCHHRRPVACDPNQLVTFAREDAP